jgi:hypothetical protein
VVRARGLAIVDEGFRRDDWGYRHFLLRAD